MFIWFPDYRQLIKEFCCIIIKLICCMEREQMYENKAYCKLIMSVWSVLCFHTYVFYWLVVTMWLINYIFVKNLCFLVDLVWKKAHWRFFRHCTLFIVQIFDSWTVNWMLFVCYMNKQAGAEFSQAYLANYELCWILPLY